MSESDVVIRVEGLGKKYSLHHEQSERYTALRDVVARQAKAAGRLLNPFTLAGQLRKAQRQVAQEQAASEEEFWALKDVSFEIRRGERVGIIGRNGAGKSTLLKILSRITEPTTGRVEIRGRVASLLEVGTGFHPELTGRENIYLNGAILGMTRREIKSKFDEIIDFSEIEKFLDTPVKRYSSGMYVRLAFAVAAHLEPDVLVVDEVLAVGDANFQKKCLGKMETIAVENNRTVLFVSHQLTAISSMTKKCIYIDNGTIKFSGDSQEAIELYSLSGSQSDIISYTTSHNQHTLKDAYVYSIMVKTSTGGLIHEFMKPLCFIFEIYIKTPRRGRTFSFQIFNQMGIPVTHCWIFESESKCLQGSGIIRLECRFETPQLNIGAYTLNTYLGGEPSDPQDDNLSGVCKFVIQNTTIPRSYPWDSSACTHYEKATWTEDNIQLEPGSWLSN